MASRGSFGFVGSIGDSRRDNTTCFLSFGEGIFSTRKRLSLHALCFFPMLIRPALCRLRRDRRSLQKESEASQTEDSREDAGEKMSQESVGYSANAVEATQAQPAWVWP